MSQPLGHIDESTPIGRKLFFPAGIQTDGDDVIPKVLVFCGFGEHGAIVFRTALEGGSPWPAKNDFPTAYWNTEYAENCIGVEDPKEKP